MRATAEIQAVPIGSSVSVREEVERAIEVLGRHDLVLETHAAGTNAEGELATILDAVRAVHETLHAEGTVRLLTYLKLETRTDKTPTLEGKRA